MKTHYPCASKHLEWPKLRSITTWFLRAHVLNDCRSDLHGSTTWFHRRAWKCYLVPSMYVEVTPVSSKCVEAYGCPRTLSEACSFLLYEGLPTGLVVFEVDLGHPSSRLYDGKRHRSQMGVRGADDKYYEKSSTM